MLVLVQSPLQHCSLPAHTRPHAPQCPTFVLMSTHSPPQQRWPVPHLPPAPHWQAPPTQVSPIPQAGSHGTSVVHVPLRQTCAPTHATPHAPQFVALLVMSTQVPPQQAWPAAHASPVPHMQALPTQVSPAAHAGSQGGSTQSPSWQSCPGAQ